MRDNIVVGKHTLESLTTGMYSDAKIIYREYIQNSVDSIMDAINHNIIKKENAKINIGINNKKSKIIIKDNGTGIPKNQAIKTLLDIGNSNKNLKKSNGFRGIGRLAGLGYCDGLTFATSYKGEKCESRITFDAKKLNKLLIPGNYKDYTLLNVIEKVTKYKEKKAKREKHYFKVILKNVKNYDDILDFNRVEKYLSQIAPVYFDSQNFSYFEQIKQKFKEENLNLDEFNIILSNEEQEEKIYKAFADNFISNRKQKIKDSIRDISIEYIKDKDDDIIAFMWYSISNFLGTIVDKRKKGIRLRKGNFQIGDRFVLNKMFKEDRFNGWFQGEVYVFDENLIPNARRDDFEKNKEYNYLIKQLKGIGNRLSIRIRQKSKMRNILKNEKELYKKIDILNGIERSNIDNKIIDLAEKIPEKDKKILDKVFNIIENEYCYEDKKKFVRTILSNY